MPLDPSTPVDNDEVYDVDRFSDMVNALEWALLGQNGGLSGYLSQTDYAIQNGTTLPADGEVTGTARAPGVDTVMGQARSTGQWSLHVRWLDEDDSVVREEGISSNTEAGRWANFSLDPKSPFVQIVVEDDSGFEQTADLTVHLQ